MYSIKEYGRTFERSADKRITGNKKYGIAINYAPNRRGYTHFGHKTWPEVIRLYKESKMSVTQAPKGEDEI